MPIRLGRLFFAHAYASKDTSQHENISLQLNNYNTHVSAFKGTENNRPHPLI